MTTIDQERSAPDIAEQVAVRLDVAAEVFAEALSEVATAGAEARRAIGRNEPLTSGTQAALIAATQHMLAAEGYYQALAQLARPCPSSTTVELGIMGQASLGLVPDLPADYGQLGSGYVDTINVGDLICDHDTWGRVTAITPSLDGSTLIGLTYITEAGDERQRWFGPRFALQCRRLVVEGDDRENTASFGGEG